MHVVRQIWSLWKRIGQAIGNVIGRLVLTVFYFTLLAPFGLGVRLWGDPLAIKGRHDIKWAGREVDSPSLDNARGMG